MKGLLLSILLGVATIALPQKKLALLVAIGKYSPESRIRPIAAVNDIKFIKAVLRKNDFPEKNIDTLINAKATYAGIVHALDALVTKAATNDIVVIHFACHGQQIRDQRTIETGKDEDDGYDEALLPYDARSVYSPTGYKGEKHLRDDLLHLKLTALRKKIGTGGSLLVLLDACHSGTGTRAETLTASRGEPVPFKDPENPLDSVIVIRENTTEGFLETGDNSLSNMVAISGSGPHQLNYQLNIDREEVGSLSYAFYKAMNELPLNSDYRMLYEKIKARIQASIPDQLPVLEGNGSQIIFSGRYKPVDEKIFIRVGLKDNAANDSIFIIEKGRVDHIRPGTHCRIFISGKDQLFAEGTIRKTENFRSIGVANKLLQKNESYVIEIMNEHFGDFAAGILIDVDKKNPSLNRVEQQLQNIFRPLGFITINKAPEYVISLKPQADKIVAQLSDKRAHILWTKTISTGDSLSRDDQKQLLSNLKNDMRVQYLRMMDDGGALATLAKIAVIPAKNPTENLDITMEPGDDYSLRIENNSDQKLFYTVLSILPDNTIEILYPFKDKDASNYSIEKRSRIIRNLGVGKNAQAGRELIKVIISKQPMDLRSVFERKKERNDNNSFQKLLDDLFKDDGENRSMRADVSSLSVEEIGILTTGFTVNKNDR